MAHANETWTVDDLKAIGGHEVSVVGHPAVVTTEVGKALRFDGVHDGIFVNAVPTADSVAFTVEVLFRPADGGETEQRFLHLQDESGKRSLLEIRVDHKGSWWLDGFLRTNLDPADKGLTLIDPSKVHPIGRWYWVALLYDGKRLANFVDGVKQVEGDGAFTAVGGGKVSLGMRQNLVYWFNGDIREVRWHREAIPDAALQRR